MSLRVRNSGFVVDILGHYYFGLNVVFEIWNYKSRPSGRQREATRGPVEVLGGNRGQFPRTDFGPRQEILSSMNAAGTPKATIVWGIHYIYANYIR